MKRNKKVIMVLLVTLLTFVGFGQIKVNMLPFCSTGIERMPWMHEGIFYFVGTNYDIYYTTFENGVWAEPKWLPGSINTTEYEINPCVITNNGKLVMYFGRYSSDTDYDFYRAEYDEEKNEWTEGVLIPEFSTDEQDWDIWVNSDETVAYFTSEGTYDGKEPVGGRDIWRSEKVDGKWSSPENVSFLNTSGNEWSVFVSPDGSIWFDSARDDTLGGYDIYRWDPDSKSIEHPEEQFNTFSDERSLWTDGKTIFFSALNRPDGEGSYDIFTLASAKKAKALEKVASKKGETITMTIKDLRQRVNDEYIYLDSEVVVEGIAMVSTGIWHNAANYFAITDKSAGILVYASGFNEPKVKKGDLVRVKGNLTTVGYTTDVNSLVIRPSSPENIEIIREGETLPDPEIIFTDSAKSQLVNLEGSLVMIFGKISNFDNETITRGFWLTGPSDRDFDNVSSGMRVKFYDYAGIDISELEDGSFAAVQGVLIQDNEGGFYVRPTTDEDIRPHTKNRVLFLTTIARKDLLVPTEEEQKKIEEEEKSEELNLPDNIEPITKFTSSDKESFSSNISGTAYDEMIYASLYKEKGTRSKNYPLAIYKIVEGNISSKVPFQGEAEFPYLRDNLLLFAGRILPDDRDSDWEIYSYNAETKEIKPLTSDRYDQLDPILCPEKDALLYSERREGKWFIVKQNFSSGERTTLIENGKSATLSPTGNDIAFQYWNGSNWDIKLLNTKTGKTTGILSSCANEFAPVWSPCGTKIAFLSNYRGEIEVFVMDLFDYSITPVTENVIPSRNPFWLNEETLGFTIHTNLGWNIVKTKITPKEKLSSEENFEEKSMLVSPRFGAPELCSSRILEIKVEEGFNPKSVRLINKRGDKYPISKITDGAYIIPDYIEDGLYSIEVFAESNESLYKQLEENSVCVGNLDENLTIVHITDPHLDIPKKPENMLLFEELLKNIKEVEPDLMLLTGDLSTSALSYTTDWNFIKEKVIEHCDYPVFIVPGNHDTQRSGKINGLELWNEIFGPDYYSFSWGSWKFMGLNTADSVYGFVNGIVSDKQLKWIRNEIRKIGNDKLIVFGHHNFYDDRWVFFEKAEQRRELLELFNNHNVVLALFGHRHSDAIDYSLDTMAITTKRAVETNGTLAYRIIRIENGEIIELVEVEPKSSVIQ
ncbi:MAG: metallophosphoesterase [Thermotogaceae bacterium]|nr:metallophosphoesterase [Thermotogaceae bacterium]